MSGKVSSSAAIIGNSNGGRDGGTGAATASDNSSDSASNNKKTTSSHKSEIEIVDQKIIKCINEINYLKQKIQREWSKQMNNHLKSFYSEDFNNADSSLNSSSNTSTQMNNNNSTPLQTNENNANSGEYEKKINLLTKKLRSYEKRRQKLLYDSKKSIQETSNENTPFKTTNDTNNNSNQNEKLSNTGSSNVLNTIGLNNTTLNESNLNGVPTSTLPVINLTPIQSHTVSNLSSLQQPGTTNTNNNKLSIRNNGSFINTTTRIPSQEDKQIIQDDNTKQSTSFYLNSEQYASNVKLFNFNQNNNQNENNNGDLLNNEDLLNNSNNANGNPKSSFDRNMIFLQVEQQIYYFKLQQEKMQADLEEIQKKIIDNQQILMKELQQTCNQISDPVQKLSFNLYKSYDQKLDDLKTSFERSIQSFNYNLTHIHRDIKETKEDVTYMKNRIEILEKTQKVHNIDANPTNYYQLFYKLLDILLTLATIILLAFTNMIASIKFIFLLYPRTIVILLFIYLVFFYLVDFDKLDVYFHRFLLNDDEYSTLSSKLKLKTNTTGSSSLLNDNKSNLTFISKLMQSLYGLIFQHKSAKQTSSSSSSS